MGCITDCLGYKEDLDLIKKEENSNTKTPKPNEEIISNQTEPKIESNKNEINISTKEDNSELIVLKTSDNKIYKVPTDILMKSKLIAGIIDDCKDEEIFLNEVDSKNLELVIDYLQHYKDKEPKEIPTPFPEKTDEEFLRGILDNDDNDWTYNFISKLSIEEAINLMNASDYLQIEGLINLLSAKLAHEMCNCDVEEARQKFGIECDMTEEEVAEYDKYPFDEDN